MKFSYSAVWEDTIGLVREHVSLLAAIAGVFIFMPALLIAALLPHPPSGDANGLVPAIIEYYRSIWFWLILQSVVSLVGTAAMLRLVLAPGVSVGAALAFGLTLLPFYFLLSLLTSVMVGLGFLLLIVPGLYLAGRLVPAAAAMVAEDLRNPLDVIQRCFALTRGHGWAIFWLVFLVAFVGVIAVGVVSALVGIVFILAAGQQLGTLLTTIVSSALGAGYATLLLVLYAAIYRALAGRGSTAAVFD